MKICELKINNGNDRYNAVIALANAGYKVSVEERKRGLHDHEGSDFWVVVEEAGKC